MAAAYPIASDVQALLTGTGLVSGSPTVTAELASAIAEFERLTGWRPFLAESVAATYRFDPPAWGSRLWLPCGFATITGVSVGVSHDSAGTALTVDEDYRTLPENAAAMVRPFTGIEFYVSCAGGSGSVRITGKRGFATTVPDDAWLAIAQRAASLALTRNAGAAALASQIEQGDLSIKAGGSGFVAAWDGAFAAAVATYRKIEV